MTLSRRRFIAICAAATVASGRAAAESPLRRWTGTAMGARASLTVAGLSGAQFGRLVATVSAEIGRLENMFSLYRAHSDVCVLNRAGRLGQPPLEFVELLSTAGSVHRLTGGAFDPTIQPVWDLYARSGGSPDPAKLAAALHRTGWDKLSFDAVQVTFATAGMALTLNGIAQGYVTDRVAGLLRRHGLRDVLVSVGEIAALGSRAPGLSWRIGVSERETGRPEETVLLKDRAIATSAPSATAFDAAGAVGHILDPRAGAPAARWRRVSVIHPSAAIADGLSTAFCSMNKEAISAALARVPGSQLIAVDRQNRRFSIGM